MRECITSRRNPIIAGMERLLAERRLRKESGLFCGEGTKLLEDALMHRAEVVTVIATAEACAGLPEIPGARVIEVPDSLFQTVSTQRSPQGVLFSCRVPCMPKHLRAGDYIVLDGLQDPGNVGTIIRTAASLGLDGVVVCGSSADPFGPKAVRASMGAIFAIPVFEWTPDKLGAECLLTGIPLLCAMPAGDAADIRKKKPPQFAAVVGNEGSGISAEMLSFCSGRIQIPMAGKTESLNAAVAAAILLWEMRRDKL